MWSETKLIEKEKWEDKFQKLKLDAGKISEEEGENQTE